MRSHFIGAIPGNGMHASREIVSGKHFDSLPGDGIDFEGHEGVRIEYKVDSGRGIEGVGVVAGDVQGGWLLFGCFHCHW